MTSWYSRAGLRVTEGAPFIDTPHGPPAGSVGDFRHAVVRLPIVILTERAAVLTRRDGSWYRARRAGGETG